ncbi:MAG: carbon-nitrogen hydrolase family protein [Alphaproteobacteria bacterium]|nr:carbon-nitrogen hydrolase family protein [Alphaproteobacteria bacterium]
MPETFIAACAQMRSSDDMAENIRDATALIREAAGKGASYIQTPENTCLMAPDGGAKLELTFAEDKDPALPAFRALAEELGIWLHIGSLAIKVTPTHVANRSYLISPKGAISASYDKIHLFDVQLANGETYKESDTVAPGSRAVIADLPWGRLGLSICYDLRFPHLYRTFGQAGCDFVAIPAAFTKTTGEAHWHILQRARAIETACYVISAAQGGRHANGRQTYGHSLIIGPWGDILAEGGTDPGVIAARIDPAEVKAARARIPSLQHDRAYAK